MGTNYYLHKKEPCPTCGHQDEPLHIGKSSAGWVFALHVDPDKGIKDLPDWEARWSKPGVKIINEYGDTITVEKMRAIILERSWDGGKWQRDELLSNGAQAGPSGLARSKIGPHCLGHGAGTYDLIPGEFS